MPRGLQVWCSADLVPSVRITTGFNDNIEMFVDGDFYTFDLDAGDYYTHHELFTSTIIEPLNRKLEENGIPVVAKLGGIKGDNSVSTVLVFEHKSPLDGHSIEGLGGNSENYLIGNTTFTVPAQKEVADLKGKAKVIVWHNSELSSNVGVPYSVAEGVNSNITVNVPEPVSSDSDIDSLVDVRIVELSDAEGVVATIEVRRPVLSADDDRDSTIVVAEKVEEPTESDGSYDHPSTVEVSPDTEMNMQTKIAVRQTGTSDMQS